ncbi:MAG: hypothetical protein E7211_08740 [Clostridium lundense]|nr:hypothetical protein [Clostridium lundense]
MSFSIDTGQVLQNLRRFDDRLRAALALDAQNIAIQMENWAKENANWQDRTGDARKYLKSHVKWEHVSELVVAIAHHKEYGIFLELANERKNAILEEAIRQYSEQFTDGWKDVIDRSRL